MDKVPFTHVYKGARAFSVLTRPEQVKVLVLDDSVVNNRSKALELLAQVYDHVEHKYQKEFTKAIAIRKYPINLTAILMVTKPRRKSFWQNRNPREDCHCAKS